jgi:hypothetical protein
MNKTVWKKRIITAGLAALYTEVLCFTLATFGFLVRSDREIRWFLQDLRMLHLITWIVVVLGSLFCLLVVLINKLWKEERDL